MMFKGVKVMPGTKMKELLEAGDTKKASKLLSVLTKMSEANYNAEVVQELRAANPDLF